MASKGDHPPADPALFSTVGNQVEGLEGGDDETTFVEEIESLCMQCEENVSTCRLGLGRR